MLEITITVPDPPEGVNVVGYEYREVAGGEIYHDGVSWMRREVNRPPYCYIVAIERKFPSSIPGFKAGAWFAKDACGVWYVFWEEPEQKMTIWGSSALYSPVYSRHTAFDILNAIDVPWDQSKFQTTEDG